MTTSHFGDPASPWHSKTEDLFDQRFVALLARTVLDPEQLAHWRTSAMPIQHAIYAIDAHYESNPVVSTSSERPLWKAVEARIAASTGRTQFAVWKRLSELRKYALVEARIHAFDLIDPREYSEIAALKASDIGIARALIWSYGSRPARAVLHFWECIDQCAELIEDLDDIAEDGRDWNFNFWLYSYLAKGEETESIIGASQALTRKLSVLEDAYMSLTVSNRANFANVFRYTLRSGTAAFRRFALVSEAVASGKMVRYGCEVPRAIPANVVATTERNQNRRSQLG